MLSKLINRLLGRQSKKPAFEKVPEPLSAPSPRSLQSYFVEEIAASPYIKVSGRDAVLQDFLHKTKLAAGEPLSLDEKRSLGLNTRFKITRGQYDALTIEGINLNPKQVLQAVYLRATFNHNRNRDIARMKEIGITQYSPLSCGDNRDCEWCASMNGKLLPINTDFAQLIKDNCTCDYCRCVVQAKLPF